MSSARHPFRSAGFTLVELMVTIAIMGVLLGIALPAYNEFVINQRVRGASMDLLSTLLLARSEAIKQNGNVSVVPVSGTTNWTSGWRIVGTDGATVRSQDSYNNIQISASFSTVGATSVVFDRTGRATDNGVTVEVGGPTANYAKRCISLGLTGQPKSAVGACS